MEIEMDMEKEEFVNGFIHALKLFLSFAWIIIGWIGITLIPDMNNSVMMMLGVIWTIVVVVVSVIIINPKFPDYFSMEDIDSSVVDLKNNKDGEENDV